MRSALSFSLLMLVVAMRSSTAAWADQRPPAPSPAFTNHLAGERSPYLLQHAHNPVDWYPWGPQAFEKARKEDKPVFLSIGYSTCHWCHVMERESFEDPQIAKLINEYFIAIKVDREERPDVDAAYMQFLLATSGSGGWPMTLFLTPNLKPFAGGTYFPSRDKDDLPGLISVLPKVHEAWLNHRDKIVESANQLTASLRQVAPTTRAITSMGTPTLDAARAAFERAFDTKLGGFGHAPKFPRPVVFNFLFHEYRRTGNKAALDMALRTLHAMADGGIHDQLGGGFHRYSTDERWFLPHFEKMLYDQAQLASSYVEAYQITRDTFYADVARDVLDYVLRDMSGPDGQLYCGEDADSAVEGSQADRRAEGAFYVWTAEQIRAVLGERDAALFDYVFGVENGGNVQFDPRGEFKWKNVLFVAHGLSEAASRFGKSEAEIRASLNEARGKLVATRARRPHPARDDKTLVAWNGLAIAALARAGQALQEPRYLAAAQRAAAFIEQKLYDAGTGKVAHSWRDGQRSVDGFLPDYAFLVGGLLDLYENDLDIRWLKWAIALQQKQDELFWDDKSGGYFDAATQADANVYLRLKTDSDEAQPAGSSIAAINLLRLAQMTDDPRLRDRADQTLAAFASEIRRSPTEMPQMLVAADFRLHRPRQIVLAGARNAPDTLAMLRAIASRYLPDKVILLADGSDGQQFLARRLPFLAAMTPIGGRAAAYVCENYACQLPTADVLKLEQMLDTAAQGAATRP